jgi:hypothetical protein
MGPKSKSGALNESDGEIAKSRDDREYLTPLKALKD